MIFFCKHERSEIRKNISSSIEKNALFRNNFLSYLFQNTKMTSHARVTVQITTGFHSWSVFLEARAFIFPSKRHTIVATIGTDVHLEKNRLKEIESNGKWQQHWPFAGYRIGTQRVFVHSTWLSESLLDSFLIRRHAL